MMTTNYARKGFTLIELLVVLTIIGLLAALLFPVFAKVRENGRQSVCESDLHQIGLAIQMYQGDNDSALPDYFFDASALPAGEQADHDTLLPYTHDPDVYHCPDEPLPPPPPHSGLLRLDYNYRIYNLISFDDVHGLTDTIIKPEPSSVLVYDDNHAHGGDQTYHGYRSGTTYIVLRANGSVSRVIGEKTTDWYHSADYKWTTACCGVDGLPWPVFPDEPWPPQFEK
jgi:prepilin-type N-terminal cleavage/methylation domain-containing protein